MVSMSKWIKFVETEPKPKTKTWAVMAKVDDALLGVIKWYASWRKYAFFPVAGTVFEPDCLRDIATFIGLEMIKRKTQTYGKSPLLDAIENIRRVRQT